MASTYLYKEEYGQGAPILCLHGLGANTFTWRHFVGPLSKHHKLILVDLKGFGRSAKPEDQRYSIHDHADSVYELILQNDWRNLTLIGNSYGGALALLLAIRLEKSIPSRLSQLVLIDAGAHKEYLPGFVRLMRTFLGMAMIFLLPARRATEFVLNFAYYDKGKISEEQINAYAAPLADSGARTALLETARQCIPSDADELVAKFKNISTPTLILWGRHDRIIPLKVGELLSQAIPNSALEVFEECGHIPQEERPQKTIARISQFLGSDSPGLNANAQLRGD
jgi:pimeloyl-ACP methyl ester carboxylesterase